MDLERIALPDKDLTAGIIQAVMKATGCDSGLLLNFAAMPLTVKRVGREHPNPS